MSETFKKPKDENGEGGKGLDENGNLIHNASAMERAKKGPEAIPQHPRSATGTEGEGGFHGVSEDDKYKVE